MHALTVGMSSCSVHNVAVITLADSACGRAAPLSPRSESGPAVLFPRRSMHGPGTHDHFRSVFGHAVNVPSRSMDGTAVHPFVSCNLQP